MHKMEIASLMRLSLIASENDEQTSFNKMLLFFTPCEDLDGSNIFAKLSANYDVIQKYIEKIDAKFIEFMNFKIRNIYFYIYKSTLKSTNLTNILDQSNPNELTDQSLNF